MPDIFDELVAEPAVQKTDIFDELVSEAPKKDIFDELAAAPTYDRRAEAGHRDLVSQFIGKGNAATRLAGGPRNGMYDAMKGDLNDVGTPEAKVSRALEFGGGDIDKAITSLQKPKQQMGVLEAFGVPFTGSDKTSVNAEDTKAADQLTKLRDELDKAGVPAAERPRIIADAAKANAWTENDEDNVRKLSTGELVVNPGRLFGQRDALVSEIQASDSDPSDKEEAISRLDAMRAAAAEKLSNDLHYGDVRLPGAVDFQDFETQERNKGNTDTVAVLDKWIAQQKDRGAGWKFIDAATSGIAKGELGIGKTVVGAAAGAAALTGLPGAETLGQAQQLLGDTRESVSQAEKVRGANGITSDIADTVTQMAPMFAGGAYAQGLTGISQKVVQGMSVYGWAAAQGYESKLSDAVDLAKERKGSDLTPEEVTAVLGDKKTQIAGLLNGFQTAILSKVLGEGSERAALGKVAESMTVRDFIMGGGAKALRDGALKKELSAMAKTVLKDASDEGVEEFTNQVLDSAISTVALGKDMKLGDLMEESLQAGALGGLVGGALPQIQRTPAENAARDLAAGAAETSPQSAAAALETPSTNENKTDNSPDILPNPTPTLSPASSEVDSTESKIEPPVRLGDPQEGPESGAGETLVEEPISDEDAAFIQMRKDESARVRQEEQAKAGPVGERLNEIEAKWKAEGVEVVPTMMKNSIELTVLQMPKDSRGQGLGTKVLDDFKALADESGKPITVLADDIAKTGRDPGPFYEKNGFTPLGKGKYVYQPTLNENQNLDTPGAATPADTQPAPAQENLPEGVPQAGVQPTSGGPAVGGEEIPLGLSRQPVVNLDLKSRSDSEFDTYSQKVKSNLDRMERAWDNDDSLGDDPAFREELANAQDDYSAVENEEFRRYMETAEPEDMAHEFRQLDPQNPFHKVKLALLLDAANRRGIQGELKPFLNEYANRSSDHAEVLAGKLADAAKVVQEMGGLRDPSAGNLSTTQTPNEPNPQRLESPPAEAAQPAPAEAGAPGGPAIGDGGNTRTENAPKTPTTTTTGGRILETSSRNDNPELSQPSQDQGGEGGGYSGPTDPRGGQSGAMAAPQSEGPSSELDFNIGPVTHGTKATFTEFKEAAKPKKDEMFSFGFHFTDSEDLAKQYGPNQMSARLSLKNPLDVEQVVVKGEGLGAWLQKIAPKTMWFPQNGKPSVYLKNALDALPAKKVKQALKDAGYDGLVYNAKFEEQDVGYRKLIAEGKTYVVLEPSQISLVSDRNADSQNNPDAVTEPTDVTPISPTPNPELPDFSAALDDDSVTGLYHAQTDADRARLGLPPRFTQPRTTDQEAWDRATAAEDAHRAAGKPGTAGTDLLTNLLENPPRVLTKDEHALLLHEKLVRQTAVEKAQKKLNGPEAENFSDGERKDAQAAVQKAQNAFDLLVTYADAAGSQAGLSLQARKMLVYMDFTLASVVNRLRAAKNMNSDTPVAWTEKDQKAAVEIASKLQQAQERIEALEAGNTEQTALIEQLTRDVERAQTKLENRMRTSRARTLVNEKLNPLVEAAKARMAARQNQTSDMDKLHSIGLTPEMQEDLKDLAIIGAGWIANKALTLEEFSRKLTAEFGDWVAEHAQMLFRNARSLYIETAESVTEGNAPTPASVVEGIDGTEPLDKTDVWALARAHVIAGLRGRNVLDSVFGDLSAKFPDLTREQVSEMFTGYGTVVYPSTKEVPAELRRIRSLEREYSKQLDIAAGLMPKRTGYQGDVKKGPEWAEVRAEQQKTADALRELENKLREAGLPVPADEKKLANALNTTKRRLTNEIEEIELAIANNTPRTPKSRMPVTPDAETQALQKKLDEKRAEYDQVFKDESAREKRILGSLKKRMMELERKMREKDFSKAPVKEPVNTEAKRKADYEFAKVRAKYDEMRHQYLLDNASLSTKVGHHIIGSSNLLKMMVLGTDVGVIMRQLGTTYQAVTRDLGMLAPTKEGEKKRADGSYLKRIVTEGARAFGSEEYEHTAYERLMERQNAGWDKTAGLILNAPFDVRKNSTEDIPPADILNNLPWWIWPTLAGVKVSLLGASFPVSATILALGTVAKPLTKALDRAQRTMTNQSRAMFFDAALEAIHEGHPTVSEAKAIAKAVMVGTGRGTATQKIESAIPMMNQVFLATRYYISRMQAASLYPLWNKDARTSSAARKEIAKMYGRSVAGRAVFYGLAALAFGKALTGDDDDPEEGLIVDPRNPNFMRLKLAEGVSIDFTSSLNQYVGLAVRMGSKSKVDPKSGEKIALGSGFTNNALDEGTKFLKSKLNMQLGFAGSLYTGAFYGGKPVNTANVLDEMTTAIIINDTFNTYDAMMKEYGPTVGAARASIYLGMMFGGAGTSVYSTEAEKEANAMAKKEAEFARKQRQAELNE